MRSWHPKIDFPNNFPTEALQTLIISLQTNYNRLTEAELQKSRVVRFRYVPNTDIIRNTFLTGVTGLVRPLIIFTKGAIKAN